MAAYAALVSLMNTMHHIQNHPRYSISLDESLGEKVDFLLDFIENYSHGASKEARVLESEIASVATSAEEEIESRIAHRIHKETRLTYLTNLEKYYIKRNIISINLKKSIEEMDSIKKRVIKIKEKMGFRDQQPPYSTSSSTHVSSTGKRAVVGFDEDLLRLMDALTGPQSNRLILSIVGMGGIGKTTLARNLYEHPFIVHHFDIRAWVTVSQQYCVREIFLKLLSCQGKSSTSEMDGKDEEQLGEHLHKSLFGMRYLIVLDDVWNTDAWDTVNRFLPNNDNGSRVIVTTRLSDMANHMGCWCHVMRFLDDDKSWKLFCRKAFGQEDGCPPELEEIGRMIVRKCKGLPLSIVVIGGLLGKSYKTQEHWENVANDKNSFLDSGDEDGQSLDILSLSYNHLPSHLKPCFLYMGVFPEDHEIHVSQLIKLWVAEGFIKPSRAQTSEEEVAEAYLKDLIDRNLILVRKLASDGQIKTCSIHDLLRDLCLKTSQKEKFLCVGTVSGFAQGNDKTRHLRVFHSLDSATFASSLVRKRGRLSFKVTLKILNMAVTVNDYSFDGILEQGNLRYICKLFSSESNGGMPHPLWEPFPSSISRLWNVQTIIIKGKGRFDAPSAIWNMQQLRHLDLPEIHLAPPKYISPSGHKEDHLVLRNLQTLTKAVDFYLTDEVCKRIPNVKKLKIHHDFHRFNVSRFFDLQNLVSFRKLESLSCSFNSSLKKDHFVQNLNFPSSLKKLSLRDYKLGWEDLTMIGSLPHLEVLKLMGWDSVSGNEWNPIEGEFLRLKFLGIYYSTELMYWNAVNTHFPVLEKLILHGLSKLDEIPSGIGEIPTLELIELDGCSESAAFSAIKILVEQLSFENERLQVRVKFLDEAKLERFRKEVKEEFGNFTSSNFQGILLSV